MNICVIGQGYVGLPIAIEAATAGHRVFGLDIDIFKIAELKSGVTDSPQVSRSQILDLQSDDRIIFITELSQNLPIDAFIIAVPTPLDESRKPDLRMLKAACMTIAKFVKSNVIIINESTSYIGTLRNFIKPLIESNSNADNLKFAVAPERIDPGNTKWQLRNTPRIISGLDKSALSQAVEIYSSFCSKIFKVDKPEVAEAAKLIENTFRQVNIALVNELSEISEKYNFSLFEAIEAAGTKPFGFMPFYPGIGVGGHCIPVDPTYLDYSGAIVGTNSKFIELANIINLTMPEKIVSRIESRLNINLAGKKIQLVGIAYKSGISDIRESPAIDLIEILESKGAHVIYFDPLVNSWRHLSSEPLNPNIDLGLIINPPKKINFEIWKKAEVKVLDLSSSRENYGWSKFL
jgi:UDP-N-acetyl-D-glucosamine dehydrogenase